MIDIHSHILPGLDDGARTIDESFEMLRLAAASGTTDIVATPHLNSEFTFDQQRVEHAFHEVSCKLHELSGKSSAIINVHLGCDFHLNYSNLSDALRDPPKYTINKRGYLLVELPESIAPPAARQALRRLIDAGILPIITHPERNPSLQSQLPELHRWVLDGCYLQITAQSLLGRFGPEAQRVALALISANLAHFIASDAHDSVDRSPDLSAAFKFVSAKYGRDRADALLIHNPAAALMGNPISISKTKLPTLLRFLKGQLSRAKQTP
jgi:protein-tyrosine phosphatase